MPNSWDEPKHFCECLEVTTVGCYAVFEPPINSDDMYDRWGFAIPQVQTKAWTVCDKCKGKVLPKLN